MTAPAPTYSHRHNLAFSRFILPAERAPQAWKLLLGIVLILVIYALGIAQLVFGAVLITGTSADVFMSMIQVPKTPGTTYFVLATFIPLLIGIFTAAAVIHGRGPMSLIGPPGKTLRHFGVAFCRRGDPWAWPDEPDRPAGQNAPPFRGGFLPPR